MTKGTLTLILASVTLSALAQLSFKYGVTDAANGAARHDQSALGALVSSLLAPGVLLGLALYGIGTLLWITVLGRVEVSQAYPFVGLGFVLTAVLGYAFFGDTLSVQRLTGIALVIGGIVLVAQS
jgi:multidrug transporter EmrE-like cation transporter